jgi:hypothetical protein
MGLWNVTTSARPGKACIQNDTKASSAGGYFDDIRYLRSRSSKAEYAVGLGVKLAR